MNVSASSQTFLPFPAWQCVRIFSWSPVGIFSHLPTCSNSQAWLGLEHLLLWKQKKVQYFFDKSKGNSLFVWKPSLQWKRPALVKSFAPTAGLSFCFLGSLSRARVLGGGSFRLQLPQQIKAPLINWRNHACNLILGFASFGVNLGITLGYVPSRMWLSIRSKNLATYFTIFWTLAQSSYCWPNWSKTFQLNQNLMQHI